MSPTVVLVVPCYNEASRLDVPAFEAALREFPFLDLLFVDDGSRDGTLLILQTLSASNPDRVRLLALQANSGKGEAVRRGVLVALEQHPAWVGYWDADLSTPIDALRDFLTVGEARPRVDVILGSRVRILGRDIMRRAPRHYAGRVFATAASLALGIPVYDTQCGAKLFRVTPETGAAFQTPFAARWAFDVELISRFLDAFGGTRADSATNRMYELGLRRWHHKPGSKLRLQHGLRAAFDLWRVYRRRLS